ncbi:SRPBCC family protein [Pseudonocardia xinjiangensis]|uniref:SRPBCC family protein n=1 Tax=Pseudonocardia xinjiangensis TaxID=75289 RepID=UPI003D8E1186
MAETTDKPSLSDALPTDALKDAGQRLLGLLVQRAAEAATDRVSGLSERLTGVAESGGQGLRTALGGKERSESDEDDDGDEGDDGESRPGFLKRGFTALKDKMKNAFGGGGGGSGGQKKLKVTVISESQDVGLPLRTTYDLWTQFADFPTFMKKVESVEQASDEKMNWKAQVFLSHRTWEATVVEQVPDSHIVWRSKGPKGHVDGGVSFTALGPNLTHIALILEYYPQGLFERTGNLWRAQGRRARLEFQHFRRHAMSNVLIHQEDVEGWRGEIHDSEVTKTHEEAIEEEQRAQEEEDQTAEDTAGAEGADEETEGDEDTGREAAEDQSEEGDEDAEDADGGAVNGQAYEEEDEAYDEDDEYADTGDEDQADEADEADEAEDEYVDEEPEEVAEADEDSDDDERAEKARRPVAASRSRRGR